MYRIYRKDTIFKQQQQQQQQQEAMHNLHNGVVRLAIIMYLWGSISFLFPLEGDFFVRRSQQDNKQQQQQQQQQGYA